MKKESYAKEIMCERNFMQTETYAKGKGILCKSNPVNPMQKEPYAKGIVCQRNRMGIESYAKGILYNRNRMQQESCESYAKGIVCETDRMQKESYAKGIVCERNPMQKKLYAKRILCKRNGMRKESYAKETHLLTFGALNTWLPGPAVSTLSTNHMTMTSSSRQYTVHVFTLCFKVKTKNPTLHFCVLICRLLPFLSTSPSPVMFVFVVCTCVRACVRACVCVCFRIILYVNCF